jgi:hypothetical protein
MTVLVRHAITGRVTGEAVAGLRAALEEALGSGRPFGVVLDRRAMSAPTPEGRAALATWGEALLPRLAGACAAWADVYDERRAASLARAGDRGSPGYPRRTFACPTEAESWVHAHLYTRAP